MSLKPIIELIYLGFNTTLSSWILAFPTAGCADWHTQLLHIDTRQWSPPGLRAQSHFNQLGPAQSITLASLFRQQDQRFFFRRLWRFGMDSGINAASRLSWLAVSLRSMEIARPLTTRLYRGFWKPRSTLPGLITGPLPSGCSRKAQLRDRSHSTHKLFPQSDRNGAPTPGPPGSGTAFTQNHKTPEL